MKEIKEIYYFGTSLDDYGHYFWIINEELNRAPYNTNKCIPFNPETFNNNDVNGTVHRIEFDDYKIIAIAGSAKDSRGGCKSVFWVKNPNIIFEELKKAILSLAPSKEIIDAMPFKILW